MRIAGRTFFATMLVVPALGFACNGILGIDAPTLADGSSGSTDAGPLTDRTVAMDSEPGVDAHRDSTKPMGDGSMHDGSERDVRREGSATRDTSADGPTPPKDASAGFDGSCSCADGSICPPVELVSGQASPAQIYVDSVAGIFWTNGLETTGSVWHANLDGTDSHQIAGNQNIPDALVYQGGGVFWIDDANGTLYSCTATACVPKSFATNIGDSLGLTATSTALFVADSITSEVRRYELVDGGPPTTSASVTGAKIGSVNGLAADSKNIYWAAGSVLGETFDGGNGVFGCPQTGCVGNPRKLGTSSSALFVVTDDTTIYWTGSDGLYSASLDGGVTSTLAASVEISPAGRIVADGTSLYSITQENIVRVAKDGSSIVTITAVGAPADLGIVGSCVYWLDGTTDAGRVYASAK